MTFSWKYSIVLSQENIRVFFLNHDSETWKQSHLLVAFSTCLQKWCNFKSLFCIGKVPDAGKGWEQEEKRVTDNELIGWHHLLNGREFEQTPGDGEGQASLAFCSPWGCKESDRTEWLNNNSKAQDRKCLHTNHINTKIMSIVKLYMLINPVHSGNC